MTLKGDLSHSLNTYMHKLRLRLLSVYLCHSIYDFYNYSERSAGTGDQRELYKPMHWKKHAKSTDSSRKIVWQHSVMLSKGVKLLQCYTCMPKLADNLLVDDGSLRFENTY